MKTLLALIGALLLAAPALHAQQHRFFGGGGDRGGARPSMDRGHYGHYDGHGYGRDGYRHGGWHGRNYYYGGIPYFYPYYGIGFGYPYYYGGWAGAGFGYGYGGGGYGAEGAYEGRLADHDNDRDDNAGPSPGHGPSLPSAVQRQLSKKGYYKGSIDGQFGPASRNALSRFQRDNDLRETGRIDEDTLDKLGFTDHP